MKFDRKVKRNQLRKEVGNKNIQSIWNKEKVNVLLEKRAKFTKEKKIDKKNNKGINQAYYNQELREINSELTKRGWSFKYKE